MAEDQLSLANVRNVLIRLEETIIFDLIERAQYALNRRVYRPREFGDRLGEESLLGFMLHECERAHALVRRYTSPDEHPFYGDLPEPILPPVAYSGNPLRPNTVNHNMQLRRAYEEEIVALLCGEGDDGQYGSTTVVDVSLLQSLSKRIHYGKFVAESKARSDPAAFARLADGADDRELLAAITEPEVEKQVLQRVRAKASVFAGELDPATGAVPVDPRRVAAVYRDWIIPMNKKVQVEYLKQTRGSGGMQDQL